MTWTLHSRSYKYNRDKTLYVHACMIIYINININLCDEIYMHVPVAEKGDRQKEERGMLPVDRRRRRTSLLKKRFVAMPLFLCRGGSILNRPYKWLPNEPPLQMDL